MKPNPEFSADLVTFTEKTLNWKLHFILSEVKAFFIIQLFVFASTIHYVHYVIRCSCFLREKND